MPAYAGQNQAIELWNNRQYYFWNNETVTAGTYPGSLSVAFALQRINQSFYPWGASVEISFSATPGTFEVDIMGANNDLPGNYVQIGSITNTSATSITGTNGFVYRYDMASNLWPKYVAAYLKTLTNTVTVTAQVTR